VGATGIEDEEKEIHLIPVMYPSISRILRFPER
jgi:hypothetical protein